MTVLVLLLILLALLGAPLFTVIGTGGLLASFNADLEPAILIIEMNRLATSPNLIAIPLFTFAGVAMTAGGTPQRLVKLFNAMFGWMPGGLAIVAIVSCAFFTAFSGASGVTILALGGLLYPMLVGEGYKERFSLGLLTTSGSLGLLFPPSLAILIYGVVAGVSIEEMFYAGLVPGALLMLFLAMYSMYRGTLAHTPRHTFSMQIILHELKACLLDVLMPILLVIGIFGGFVSINEAAACTAAYILIIETLVFREINLKKQLFDLLVDTSVLVGSILIILGVALGLTNLLIDAQIPMRLLAMVENTITSQLGFLLLLNGFLLLAGATMDIFSAIVVIVPLILPLARNYGVDPIHLGIIFLANLEIGYSTPPVGINLFIASQRFNEPVLKLFRSTLPFLVIMLVWLLLITYIPELSLWWR